MMSVANDKTNTKVGRPKKNVAEKKATESNYNKLYYVTVTKTKKILADISTGYQKEKLQLTSKNYNTALVDFFSKYSFNNFFTGTTNCTYVEREKLKILNDRIKQLNKEHGIDSPLITKTPISLRGLVRYTNRYLNHLIEAGAIDRGIVFFEQSKAKEWHCHILLNFVNKLVIDVNNYLENKWLMGICLNVTIESNEDKTKILQYSVKQLSLNDSQRAAKEKNLNWNIIGDFPLLNNTIKKRKHMKTLTPQEKREIVNSYKAKNNMTTKVDAEQQKKLNDKFLKVSL